MVRNILHLALALLCFAKSTLALDPTVCAAKLAGYSVLLPAEVGGRPSDLRQFLEQLRDERADLASYNRPEDLELIARIDQWIVSLEAEIRAKDNGKDSPILGYGLPGFTRPGETLLDLPGGPTTFENVATTINTDPDRIGAEPEVLRTSLNEVRNDRDKLARRGYPEDLVLVARADRWIKRLEARLGGGTSPADGGVAIIGFATLDGSVLGGDDGEDDFTGGEGVTARETLFERARKAAIDAIYELAAADPELGRALKASAAARLSKREQLLYLSTHPRMLPIIVAYAEQTLPKRRERDPRLIGGKVIVLRNYEIETQILLEVLKEAKGPSGTTAVVEAWLKVMRARLEPYDNEPDRVLDGPGLLGLSTLGGGFRLGTRRDPSDLAFIPPLEPLETFLTEARGSRVPEEAFEPELKELPRPMSALLALVEADAVLGRAYTTNFRQVTTGRNPPKSRPRAQLIALMRNDDTRRLLVAVAREMIQRRQYELRAKKGAVRRVDILFIGAGLAQGNMDNYLRQNPGLKSITSERKPVVAFTFRQGGYAFSLNSTTRVEDRTSLRQMFTGGTSGDATGGDLNFLPGGVIQINRFETRQNPVAASMADTVEVNRALNLEDAPVMVTTEASDLEWIGGDEKASEGGRYEFRGKLSDGTTVLARVAIDTGIGEPTLPDIPGLKEAYALAKEKREPGKPPRLLNLEDVFAWINGSDDPYAPFSGATVGTGGPGDSGKAVIRWFGLLADPKSYGGSTRDLPLVKTQLWYGQPCADCDAFTEANRSFYFDITRLYRRPRNQGGLVARPRIAKVNFDGTNLSVVSDGEEDEEPLDYLALTLGYQSLLPKLITPMLTGRRVPRNPNDLVDQKAIFRDVMGYEPSLGKVVLARQLVVKVSGGKDRPVPFYVVGAGSGKGVVSDKELKNNEENRVANANQAWRAWLFIEGIRAQLGVVSVGGKFIGDEEPPAPEVPSWITTDAFTDRFTAKIDLDEGQTVKPPEKSDELLFATRLWTEIAADIKPGVTQVTLTVTRVQANGNTYEFRTGPEGVSPKITSSIGAALVRSSALRQQVASLLGEGSPTPVVTIDFRIRDTGELNGEDTTVTFRRRAATP